MIARHTFKVEYVTGLLKGEATKQLKDEGRHPLTDYRDRSGAMPTPWNVKSCRIYLDTENGIEEAIRYVEDNPQKEAKPRQSWSCVTPFAGLDNGWVTYQ